MQVYSWRILLFDFEVLDFDMFTMYKEDKMSLIKLKVFGGTYTKIPLVLRQRIEWLYCGKLAAERLFARKTYVHK